MSFSKLLPCTQQCIPFIDRHKKDISPKRYILRECSNITTNIWLWIRICSSVIRRMFFFYYKRSQTIGQADIYTFLPVNLWMFCWIPSGNLVHISSKRGIHLLWTGRTFSNVGSPDGAWKLYSHPSGLYWAETFICGDRPPSGCFRFTEWRCSSCRYMNALMIGPSSAVLRYMPSWSCAANFWPAPSLPRWAYAHGITPMRPIPCAELSVWTIFHSGQWQALSSNGFFVGRAPSYLAF